MDLARVTYSSVHVLVSSCSVSSLTSPRGAPKPSAGWTSATVAPRPGSSGTSARARRRRRRPDAVSQTVEETQI